MDIFHKLETGRLSEQDPAIAFAIKLGSALHRYGAPAHRLEEVLGLVMAKIGLVGQFLSTPTGIFAAFGNPEDQRTTLIRVDPGSIDLEKLALLDDLTTRVIRGEIDLVDSAAAVDEIVARAPRYGPIVTSFCFGIASGTAARFLGGGWREIGAATIIGIMIGLLALVSGRSQTIPRIFEPIAALMAAALAILIASTLTPISIYLTTLAGLITLLPGFGLTVAMIELATRNLISGTARLMGAILIFFEIGFGVALGNQLNRVLPPLPQLSGNLPLPAWTEWLALLLAPLAFTVLFKARPRDAGWIVLSGVISFIGARWGAFLLGPEFGVCVGALMVGLGSNLYAQLLKRTSIVPLVPGMMLLVPGSIGFGSLARFMEKDIISGVEAGFKMVIVAVALVTGLLMANVALPRKPL